MSHVSRQHDNPGLAVSCCTPSSSPNLLFLASREDEYALKFGKYYIRTKGFWEYELYTSNVAVQVLKDYMTKVKRTKTWTVVV